MADSERTAGRWTRRRVLIGVAAVGAAGVAAVRRGDHGGAHDAYFRALSSALRDAAVARPALVIDRARLRANVAALTGTLAGSRLATRIVVKSLPCRSLLAEVARGVGTDRFMVFNGPMILETSRWRPDGELLLGKPLAAAEVAAVCDGLAALQVPGPGPQWLVDTPERIRQYAAIGQARNRALRVNLELDVGLHRGGFRDADDLAAALDLVKQSPHLTFAGLMGYDPHVPKMPSPGRAYDAVIRRYTESVEVVRSRFGTDTSSFTFNTAGSPPTPCTHATASRPRWRSVRRSSSRATSTRPPSPTTCQPLSSRRPCSRHSTGRGFPASRRLAAS